MAGRRPTTNAEGQKVFRIGAHGSFNATSGFRLTVPAKLARQIGPDAEFTLEVTEEGLLYRYSGGRTRPADPPHWLR